MSDIRHDPLNEIWVAMADNRRERPMEFVPEERMQKQIICPFCKGNESETPSVVAVYDADGQKITSPGFERTQDWTGRVVLNKFPSFSPNAQSQPSVNGRRLSKRLTSPGVQELIIPTPRHLASLAELSDDELEVCFRIHQDRVRELADHAFVEHVMLFLNCRSSAGASLGHIHWQVIGSPLISQHVQLRHQRNLNTRTQNGKTLVRMMLDQELNEAERILQTTDNFAIICPFASKFPFQVQLIPLDPIVEFSNLDDERRDELAWLCRDVVDRLESLLDAPAYNILLHLPPSSESSAGEWYFEVFPRITTAAGYELGTDVWVNPVAPEKAVRALRAAKDVKPELVD